MYTNRRNDSQRPPEQQHAIARYILSDVAFENQFLRWLGSAESLESRLTGARLEDLHQYLGVLNTICILGQVTGIVLLLLATLTIFLVMRHDTVVSFEEQPNAKEQASHKEMQQVRTLSLRHAIASHTETWVHKQHQGTRLPPQTRSPRGCPSCAVYGTFFTSMPPPPSFFKLHLPIIKVAVAAMWPHGQGSFNNSALLGDGVDAPPAPTKDSANFASGPSADPKIFSGTFGAN